MIIFTKLHTRGLAPIAMHNLMARVHKIRILRKYKPKLKRQILKAENIKSTVRHSLPTCKIRVISVGIAVDYGLDGLDSVPGIETTQAPIQPPIQRVPGGGKAAGE
jgi:hypothetical protein